MRPVEAVGSREHLRACHQLYHVQAHDGPAVEPQVEGDLHDEPALLVKALEKIGY